MTNTALAQITGSGPVKRFARDESGNIAILFGFSLVPLLLFVGASVDYTRSNTEHVRLQSAIDSTALALAHEPRNTPQATLQAKAQQVFAANFQVSNGGSVQPVFVLVSDKTIKVSTQSALPTSFMALGGTSSVAIGATSEVAFGTKNIEIALALDNTGSMAQNGKIQALRAAVDSLLVKLESTSRVPGDIKVSLVPFTSQVKIATSYKAASWLRWDVTLENTFLPANVRTPPTPATWTGCLSDRDQIYDAQSVPPVSLQSNYVASKCQNDGLLPMAMLTSDLESVRASARLMQPLNSTNITVGFVNAMSTLRPDHPFGTNSVNNADTVKFLVLLTDGNNTANRFGGAGWDFNPYAPAIDARLSDACTRARNDGTVKVFTIRVMDGNAALLQSCASQPSMYYDVQNAGQLQGVFDDIAHSIINIHIQS